MLTIFNINILKLKIFNYISVNSWTFIVWNNSDIKQQQAVDNKKCGRPIIKILEQNGAHARIFWLKLNGWKVTGKLTFFSFECLNSISFNSFKKILNNDNTWFLFTTFWTFACIIECTMPVFFFLFIGNTM